MNKQIIIGRTKSAKEFFELMKIIKHGRYNWSNFKEGDIVYIESLSPLNLPNLVVQSITNDEVCLAAI